MKGDDRSARCGHHTVAWKNPETMNYLESIALSKTLPCLADPGKNIVVGTPDRSLEVVIPYLANLPGIIAYNPETCTLTFRRQPGFLTLSPEKVYITQVQDTEEGLVLLANLKDAINATWEHRHTLLPATVKRQPAGNPGHPTSRPPRAERSLYQSMGRARSLVGPRSPARSSTK